MSLRDLVDLYCQHRILSVESKRALGWSARRFERFVAPEVAANVALVTRDMFLQFRADVLKTSRPASFNTYRAHLHLMFALAKEEGWCTSDPTDRVTRAPVPNRRKKVLQPGVVDGVLSYLRGLEDAESRFWIAVTKTLHYTGMRRRQLIELQWQDVQFADGLLVLRAESSKNRKEWTVPMVPDLVQTLRALRQQTLDTLGRAPHEARVFNPQVFSSTRAPYLTGVAVTGYFRHIGTNLGTRISPHRFRHTFATKLANSGTNLRLVQHLLGHSSIAITCTYVEPDTSALRRALDALESLAHEDHCVSGNEDRI